MHSGALVNAKEFTKQFNERWTWGGSQFFHFKKHEKLQKNVKKKMHLSLQLMVHLKMQPKVHLWNLSLAFYASSFILYSAEQTELLANLN